MATPETPLYVVKALAEVRENGSVDMMDRDGVTALASGSKAIEWLERASDSQYMNALNDMGAYISGDDTVEPESTSDDDNDTWGW